MSEKFACLYTLDDEKGLLSNEDLVVFINTLCSCADDIVNLAENADELQTALNSMLKYCT
jgi:hypothetical protein